MAGTVSRGILASSEGNLESESSDVQILHGMMRQNFGALDHHSPRSHSLFQASLAHYNSRRNPL